MTAHARSRLAWGLATFGITLGVGAAALAVANSASIHSLQAANPLEIVMSLTFAFVGGLIASQRPRNPVGWLFLFMAIVMGAGGVAAQYSRLAAITHPGLPGAQWALWWSSLVRAACLSDRRRDHDPAPDSDGRLPSSRWRAVIPVALIVTIVLTLLGALGSSPLRDPTISHSYRIRSP